MLFLATAAYALTLEEAVARAAEVDPSAVIAALEWEKAKLDAGQAWLATGPTPELRAERKWSTGAVADRATLDVTLATLSAGAWFDAASMSSDARAAKYDAAATALDVQYAAAALYYAVLAAMADLDAARRNLEAAEATTRASRARVSAGLDSELSGRSAEAGRLEAEARVAKAEATLAIARARLSRALEQEVGDLAAAGTPELPMERGSSPWLQAEAARITSAELGHYAAVGDLLPSGKLVASTPLWLTDWQLALAGSWTFEGIAGPFLKERSRAIDARIAAIQYDALQRDLDLDFTESRARAAAARRVAEASRAREQLAAEALRVGQARLEAGLASTLEVLRLQDDLASARSARVASEFDEALSILEARRVAGLGF
jgi:outer membrane protein TolC